MCPEPNHRCSIGAAFSLQPRKQALGRATVPVTIEYTTIVMGVSLWGLSLWLYCGFTPIVNQFSGCGPPSPSCRFMALVNGKVVPPGCTVRDVGKPWFQVWKISGFIIQWWMFQIDVFVFQVSIYHSEGETDELAILIWRFPKMGGSTGYLQTIHIEFSIPNHSAIGVPSGKLT